MIRFRDFTLARGGRALIEGADLQIHPGWRVGLLTSEPMLARATALPFLPPAAPVPHGGLRVTLFQTTALP